MIRALFVLALLGCATAPPESLYTLAAGAAPATRVGSDRAVLVGPVSLPELVDRPQLVRQAEAQRVTIAEHERWAEPLRTAVPRVVAEDLSVLLDGWRVSPREDALGRPECRVTIDVRRLEAQLRAVRLEALWTVACEGTARLGRTLVVEPAQHAGADAVVAAHGRALDALSRDIAEALRRAN
jgi:uncharacterized protein